MTAIPNAKAEAVKDILDRFNNGRIKLINLPTELYGGHPSQMPEHVEQAFMHAAGEHRTWLVSETPEGGRDVPDSDPLTPAETCRRLFEEALTDLVQVVDAYVAERNTRRSAA